MTHPETPAERHLTHDEQRVMHAALRKSATLVHKAESPADDL